MKNTLIKSTIILIIGGLITKLLSMIIRIIMSRMLGSNGIGMYMMLMPTFNLFIAIASMGLPQAISKLVSEDTKNNKNLVFSIIPITLLFNMIIILGIVLLSNTFATNFLHNSNYKYPIIAIGIVLPFISISSILRGYFFGKEKMIPHVVSNIFEDIVRLILIIKGIPYFLTKGIMHTVTYIILTNVVSELSSILILFIFLPKHFSLSKKDFKLSRLYIADILKIGIPTTSSRLIGLMGCFLEPIIINAVLLHIGYSSLYITKEYGIITGYVMPILLLPSFFSLAISNAILPVISKLYVQKEKDKIKKKIKQGIYYSLIIGIPFTCFIFFFPKCLLNFLYHTNEGISYIKILAPIFLFHYIQSVLTSALQAMNASNQAFKNTLIGTILKTIVLFLFSYLKIGLYPLIISLSINIIYVTCKHYKVCQKILN